MNLGAVLSRYRHPLDHNRHYHRCLDRHNTLDKLSKHKIYPQLTHGMEHSLVLVHLDMYKPLYADYSAVECRYNAVDGIDHHRVDMDL